MKSTDAFKQTIKSHLEALAKTDILFAEKFQNPAKNIDDCCTYILNTVQATGCNGFEDDEIYGMAIHYYDEDSIDVGKIITARVAVNHTVELTEEEKQKSRQDAIDKYQQDIYNSFTAKKEKKAEKQPIVEQTSLFD